MLIGADGINSMTRTALQGEIKPRPLGYQDWGAVVEFTHPKAPAGYYPTYWGPGTRLGIANIGGGRVYWAAALAAAGGHGRRGADAGRDARALRGLAVTGRGRDPRDLTGRVLRRPDPRSQAARPLGRGPRDAARRRRARDVARTPAAGVSEALEDAVILALKLRRVDLRSADKVGAVLRDYEFERRKATAQVTALSRQIGMLGQWSSPGRAPPGWRTRG